MGNYTVAIKKCLHLFCIEGVDKDVTAYNKEKLDNKNPVSELLLFAIGDEFLKKNRFSEAASVFTLAATDYPTSHKAFYKLGASYMLARNKEFAIKYFEKSLLINPQYKIAEEKLRNLKGEK
jgi:tetratricopeptide (TPR) repeat protein